jgi:hypothetical protein
MRKRTSDDWICKEFPNCTCGRASQYSAQPLYRYTTGANGPGNIADCYVTLKCIKDHAPDIDVRIMALSQLMHPKFDDLHPVKASLRYGKRNKRWMSA